MKRGSAGLVIVFVIILIVVVVFFNWNKISPLFRKEIVQVKQVSEESQKVENSASNLNNSEIVVKKNLTSTCTDSDGGIKQFDPGKVSYCDVNGKCVDFLDKCLDSENLEEYYCKSSGDVGEFNISCDYGCDNSLSGEQRCK